MKNMKPKIKKLTKLELSKIKGGDAKPGEVRGFENADDGTKS